MSNACRVQVFLPQQRVSVFIYTIPPDLAWLDLGSVVTWNFKGVFAKDHISTCRAESHVSVTGRYVWPSLWSQQIPQLCATHSTGHQRIEVYKLVTLPGLLHLQFLSLTECNNRVQSDQKLRCRRPGNEAGTDNTHDFTSNKLRPWPSCLNAEHTSLIGENLAE